MSIRDEVSAYLAAQGYSATEIEKVVTCLTGEGNAGLTLKEARDVRTAVFEARLTAKRKGEDTRSLGRLYDALTTAMRKRAIDLGMVEDFDKAESASRAVERDKEILDPLLSVSDGVEGALEFQRAWTNRTPEMRAALNHLQESGGLDLKSLEAEGRRTEDFLRNLEASKRMTWFERKPQLSAILVLLIAAAWWGVTWHDRLRFAVALGTTVVTEGCILWGPMARVRAKVRALESEIITKKEAPHER